MNILIDECLHTSLVEVAVEHGHQATHVTWRGMGGRQDWNLMEPIREESRTFVTNNAKDFRRLYAQAELHAGLLIIVPQVPPVAQRELFAALLEDISGEELVNEVVEIAFVEGEAAINRYPLPDEPGEPEEATEHDAEVALAALIWAEAANLSENSTPASSENGPISTSLAARSRRSWVMALSEGGGGDRDVLQADHKTTRSVSLRSSVGRSSSLCRAMPNDSCKGRGWPRSCRSKARLSNAAKSFDNDDLSALSILALPLHAHANSQVRPKRSDRRFWSSTHTQGQVFMATGKERTRASTTAVGAGGETHQSASAPDARLTTNHGVPISDNQNSLKGGRRGPTLLEDFVLREKIQHFDHERIPERIVHARGSAAHGFFELTESLADVTRAKVLTEVGEKTEVFVRFSTVAGGAGSVDTPRDVRGFAVKLYTKEGNWDLVGNNIPVFFIQDAMKFPDLVHSVKMEADRGYPQAASAHDTFWDFVGLMPETTHMIMWAMSDRAIPRSFRMMEGFGVNTFRLLNDADEATFVKFHWRPKLGLQSTCWDEAVKIAGADPDYQRRDLHEAIERGDYPEWEFGVQLLSQAEADALPFDILDATKVIPEELVPIRVVGRLVLNRNPDNFFAETEQAAFLPTNVPPGVDFSEDPLLQGRLFSYQDTQLSRLGTVNFHQIPINSAKGCPFQNLQRDGKMQTLIPKGRANYEPNSLAEHGEVGGPREDPDGGFRSFALPLEETKTRLRAETFADHYSHARLFYRSQSTIEQAHLASAIVFELSKVAIEPIRVRVMANLRNVDEDLAARVAAGLNMALPAKSKPAVEPIDMKLSPGLRLIDKYPASLKGRAVAILVTDGAAGGVVAAVREAVEGAGAAVKIIAPKIGGVTLSDGGVLKADGQLAGSPSVLFDAVALVLSEDGCAELLKESAAIDFVHNAFVHLKAIAFTPSARPLLHKAGVELDAGIVELGAAKAFVEPASSRQWDREASVRTLA